MTVLCGKFFHFHVFLFVCLAAWGVALSDFRAAPPERMNAPEETRKRAPFECGGVGVVCYLTSSLCISLCYCSRNCNCSVLLFSVAVLRGAFFCVCTVLYFSYLCGDSPPKSHRSTLPPCPRTSLAFAVLLLLNPSAARRFVFHSPVVSFSLYFSSVRAKELCLDSFMDIYIR